MEATRNKTPLFVRQFSTIDQDIAERLKAAVQLYNAGSIQKALVQFEVLAFEDIPDAHVYLGMIFLQDKQVGRAKDAFTEAIRLHNDSSHNYLSHYHRGYLHEMGYGVEQDYEKATLHYQLAGNNKDLMGFIRLAELHEQGFGETPADLAMANTWYEHILQTCSPSADMVREINQKIAANTQRLASQN